MKYWTRCLPLLPVALLLTGCYNTPTTGDKSPGQGTKNITGGPDVGPGTVAGGSTAGRQPVATERKGEEHKAEEPAKH